MRKAAQRANLPWFSPELDVIVLLFPVKYRLHEFHLTKQCARKRTYSLTQCFNLLGAHSPLDRPFRAEAPSLLDRPLLRRLDSKPDQGAHPLLTGWVRQSWSRPWSAPASWPRSWPAEIKRIGSEEKPAPSGRFKVRRIAHNPIRNSSSKASTPTASSRSSPARTIPWAWCGSTSPRRATASTARRTPSGSARPTRTAASG